MKKQLVIYSFLLFIIWGCGNNSLSIRDYIIYYANDKAFEAKTVLDSVEIKARVMPKEYIALLNLGPQVFDMTSKSIDSNISLTEDFSYVFLELKNIYSPVDMLCWGCSDSISLESRINYLSDSFHKSISLVSNGDTISCSISQLERTYQLTDKTKIVLGFDYSFKKLKQPLFFIIKKTNRIDHQFHCIEFSKFEKNKIKILSL